MRTKFGILIAAIFSSLILSIAQTNAQSEPEKLVVYSGRSEGLIGPVLELFTADTGIQVEVRYGGTAEMAATILEEGDNSPADVYIAQDAGALGALAAEGRLAKLSPDILERVPANFASSEGMWVGVSGRVRALVYNTNMVQEAELPASLMDMTKTEWSRRVGWAPTNGSFQSNITAMRVLLGEDVARQWLEDMIANEPVTFESNDAIVQAVINGEIAAGLVNHYYIFEFKEQIPDAPIAIHYFQGGDIGGLVNVAGAGIVNTSKHPGLGQRFLLYLLGNTAQSYFAETTAEYPLVPGVSGNPIVKPLSEIQGPEIDLSLLSDLQATLDLLRDTGATP